MLKQYLLSLLPMEMNLTKTEFTGGEYFAHVVVSFFGVRWSAIVSIRQKIVLSIIISGM